MEAVVAGATCVKLDESSQETISLPVGTYAVGLLERVENGDHGVTYIRWARLDELKAHDTTLYLNQLTKSHNRTYILIRTSY